MKLTRDKQLEQPAGLTSAQAAAADAARRAAWANRRLHWLERLALDERAALAGNVTPADRKTIERAYAEAREAWESADPPENWEPPTDLADVVPLSAVLGSGARHRQREFHPGELDPTTGEPVPDGQRVTATVDMAVGHARAVAARACAEASPPPEREDKPDPFRENPLRKFTPDGVVSALQMPAGAFTGARYRPPGEVSGARYGMRKEDAA